MGRNTDDQDGAYAEGTAKWPTEENRPQGKPSVKKSQSSKGKDIILNTLYLKNSFLAPSLEADTNFLLHLMSVNSWNN